MSQSLPVAENIRSLSTSDVHDLELIAGRLHGINDHQQPDILRQLAVVLEKDDHVGLSFWLAAGFMLASTAFFFSQVFLVPRRWANSMICCGLITGVAWHHYMYMKDIWTENKSAPTIYRYMDWLITVPLQVVEFYLILVAANPPDKGKISVLLFLRLLTASVGMLTFGYLGETGVMERWPAFACGFILWLYILYEVFIGEASLISARLSLDEAKKFLARISGREESEDGGDDTAKNAIQKALNTSGKSSANAAYAVALKEFKKPEAQLAFEILRVIILLGWALYPAGYVIGSNTQTQEEILNAVYNLADLINKVAFGLAIYFAAGSQNEKEKEIMLHAKLPTLDELVNGRSTSFAHQMISYSQSRNAAINAADKNMSMGQLPNNGDPMANNPLSLSGNRIIDANGNDISMMYNNGNPGGNMSNPNMMAGMSGVNGEVGTADPLNASGLGPSFPGLISPPLEGGVQGVQQAGTVGYNVNASVNSTIPPGGF